MWRKMLETEHGTLFVSDKGSTYCILKCRRCGAAIKSTVARANTMTYYYHQRWVRQGNKYAVCNVCDSSSSFKRIEPEVKS